jgi:rfaE bifunctional protein kinase chain/domain
MALRTLICDKRILVVGDIMLDRYWFGEVDRISPEAPVPVVHVAGNENRAGGAANVALNVAGVGASCRLLSVIGDDEAGRTLADQLSNTRVECHLHIDPDYRTTEKLRIVARNQQLLRADFEKLPNSEILSRCLDDYDTYLSQADAVVMSDYGKGGLVHETTMIQMARASDIPIVVDPKGPDFSRYRGATVVTPNLHEFETAIGRRLTDEKDMAKTAKELAQDLELGALLVTRSEKGMSLYPAAGGEIHSPAKAREVYDVSGAGDTVVAVVASCLAANLEWEQTLTIANVAASIVVGKLGAVAVQGEEIEVLLSAEDTA